MNDIPDNKENFILDKDPDHLKINNSPDPRESLRENRNVSLEDNLQNKILEGEPSSRNLIGNIPLSDEGLTLERIAEKIFPELIRKDETKKKTYIDKRKLDIGFLKGILDKKDSSGKKKSNNEDSNSDLLDLMPRSNDFGELEQSYIEEDSDIKVANNLSYNLMQRFVDENHPRDQYMTMDKKIKMKPFPLGAPMGYTWWKENPIESALLPYGIGITLYFKYLKYLIAIFLVLFLLNLPVIALMILTKDVVSSEANQSSFNSFLFSFTFGNLGPSIPVCGVSTPVDQGSQTLSFTCPSGTRIVNYVGLSPNGASCNLTQDQFTQISSEQYENCSNVFANQIEFTQNCRFQPNCSLTFLNSLVSSISECGVNGVQSDVLGGFVICEAFIMKLDSLSDWQKSDVYTVFILFDFLSISVFALGYFLVLKSEAKQIKKYMYKELRPERYTIKIKGIKEVTNVYTLIYDLQKHFEKHFSKEVDTTIADVNVIFENDETLVVKEEIGSILKKISAVEYLINKADQLKVADTQFNTELALKHHEVTTELDIAKQKLYHIEQIKLKKLRSCFVTFNHVETARYILGKFEEDKINRIIALEKEEFRYFKYQRLRVTKPTPPSNVQWQNIIVTKTRANIRRIIINVVEVFFLVFSFYFLMYWQLEKINYLELLTPKNCVDYSNVTPDIIADNWNNKGFLQCYCNAKFPGTIEEQLAASQNSFFDYTNFQCQGDIPQSDPYYYYQNHSPCYDYFSSVDKFDDGLSSLFLLFGMSGLIAAINGATAGLYILFSKLMKRPTVSSELKEAAIGVFIMQLLNSGFLMLFEGLDSIRLITSYYIPPTNNLFLPICSDYTLDFEGNSIFNTNWFLRNGGPLMVAAFLSSITFQLGSLIIYLGFQVYRWYDRGFTHDKSRSRKLIQSDFNKVYKGPMIPLDNGYSTLYTLVGVALMYTTGIPLMYLFTAISLLVLYWVDKYLTLRFYSNPPCLDDKFVKKTQEIIPYCILFHMAFAVMFYGSLEIAPPDISEYQTFFSKFINQSNVIVSNTELSFAGFFENIADFYSSSLNRPVTYTFGILTVLLFLFLFMRIVFYLPCKRLIKTTLRLDKKKKQLLPTGETEKQETFIELIESHYLKEKIQILKRQEELSRFPDDYKRLFDSVYDKYSQEYNKRKINPTLKNRMKGNPFYGFDCVDEYRKKFGLDYSQKLTTLSRDNSKQIDSTVLIEI